LTGKARKPTVGRDRDYDCGNRSDAKVIEDLIGRVPIPSKQIEDFKTAFS
jgi:hypothetical protein